MFFGIPQNRITGRRIEQIMGLVFENNDCWALLNDDIGREWYHRFRAQEAAANEKLVGGFEILFEERVFFVSFDEYEERIFIGCLFKLNGWFREGRVPNWFSNPSHTSLNLAALSNMSTTGLAALRANLTSASLDLSPLYGMVTPLRKLKQFTLF